LTETKLKFTGVGEKEQNQYEAEIEFYGNVDVEVSYSTLH
jgi:prostaglandin-E synthase